LEHVRAPVQSQPGQLHTITHSNMQLKPIQDCALQLSSGRGFALHAFTLKYFFHGEHFCVNFVG